MALLHQSIIFQYVMHEVSFVFFFFFVGEMMGLSSFLFFPFCFNTSEEQLVN